jgi:hypothetical protein
MTNIEITNFMLGLAGALAWTPFIVGLFKKATLKGRIIGLTVSPDFTFSTRNPFTNANEVIKGIGYSPKFSFISLNKDFNIHKVGVSVKYPGESELRKGIIFYSSKTKISFEGEDSQKKILNIPVEEHISSILVLEHGKQVPVFITFGVTRQTFAHFEYIRIKFTDFDGRDQIIEFHRNDIDVKNMIFEEKYWSTQ